MGKLITIPDAARRFGGKGSGLNATYFRGLVRDGVIKDRAPRGIKRTLIDSDEVENFLHPPEPTTGEDSGAGSPFKRFLAREIADRKRRQVSGEGS